MCYIRRSDRGAALQGVRLIGAHTDDAWHAGNNLGPTMVSDSIRQSAGWIRDRIQSRELAMICLDPDGAVCSWVKPEDADATMLETAIEGAGSGIDQDLLDPEAHAGISERFPQLPLELNFELLPADETSTGSRAAVMACPDIPGRLLKDELDAMGVRVGRFTTIWHAGAAVWDPGADSASQAAQRIVSSDTPIAACVLIDPTDGRLIWTWSREGRLITGGTIRIQRTGTGSDSGSGSLVRQQDIARLGADWLAWSSQLGVSPSRIVLVGNPTQIQGEATNSEGAEQSAPPMRGMSPGQIGMALSKAWPGATIDFIEHDDPIAETLNKIATGQRGQSLESLIGLSGRPVKAHRSMYRWAGVALLAIAATIVLLAMEMKSQATDIENQTKQLENQRMELINGYDAQLVLSMAPEMDLDAKLKQLRGSQKPIEVARTKPILEELETLSHVFGIPGIEVSSIKLTSVSVTIIVKVDEITEAEQINQSLSLINGSNLSWNTMSPRTRGDKIEATFFARWQLAEVDS